MNIALPEDAFYQIASSTNSVVAGYADVAVLAGGVLLALFVAQVLIQSLADRWYPQRDSHGV